MFTPMIGKGSMTRYIDYIYIFATVLLTAAGQLLLKWRMVGIGGVSDNMLTKPREIIAIVFDPVILTVFTLSFLSSLAWIAAVNKFELSFAYPFLSLNFVVILLISGWLLNEPITLNKMLGVFLISLGTIVIARG